LEAEDIQNQLIVQEASCRHITILCQQI